MTAAIDAAMKTPDADKRLKGVGIEPIGGTRASFDKFVDEERARLGAVVKATGMKDEWNEHDPSRHALRAEGRERGAGLLVPGAANALAARVIEDLGFEAVYLTGAGVTNTFYGLPDLGFIDLRRPGRSTRRRSAMRSALPLIVDADTGFGNALNVRHTVRTLERAGANAIQLEDQVMPKKCGHFDGKAVITRDEMVGKIKAAVDARVHADFLIIARTDAARGGRHRRRRSQRAAAYAEAGADITFVEAPESLEELRAHPARTAVPAAGQCGDRRQDADTERRRVRRHGLRPGALRQRRAAGRRARHDAGAAKLRDGGRLEESSGLVATFAERQALVRKKEFDELDKRYA